MPSRISEFMTDAGQRPYRELVEHHMRKQSTAELQLANAGESSQLASHEQLSKRDAARWNYRPWLTKRLTAASCLLFQKVPPRVVMELLGNSGIRVTMDLYSHVAPVLQRDAADQMDALLRTAKAAKK